MNLVLDTDALWHAPLMEALVRVNNLGLVEAGFVSAVLPAVAYAERARQVARDARSREAWLAHLARAGIVVEALTRDHIDVLPSEAKRNELWLAHARDFLIAAHVTGDRIGVTGDQGPAWRGRLVWTPAQARNELKRLFPARSEDLSPRGA